MKFKPYSDMDPIDVGLYITQYKSNNTLAIVIVESESKEIYGNLTVNLGETPQDCQYVDVNNVPLAEEFIKDNELGKPVGLVETSGFVTYPLYKFNLSKLKEFQTEIPS